MIPVASSSSRPAVTGEGEISVRAESAALRWHSAVATGSDGGEECRRESAQNRDGRDDSYVRCDVRADRGLAQSAVIERRHFVRRRTGRSTTSSANFKQHFDVKQLQVWRHAVLMVINLISNMTTAFECDALSLRISLRRLLSCSGARIPSLCSCWCARMLRRPCLTLLPYRLFARSSSLRLPASLLRSLVVRSAARLLRMLSAPDQRSESTGCRPASGAG